MQRTTNYPISMSEEHSSYNFNYQFNLDPEIQRIHAMEIELTNKLKKLITEYTASQDRQLNFNNQVQVKFVDHDKKINDLNDRVNFLIGKVETQNNQIIEQGKLIVSQEKTINELKSNTRNRLINVGSIGDVHDELMDLADAIGSRFKQQQEINEQTTKNLQGIDHDIKSLASKLGVLSKSFTNSNVEDKSMEPTQVDEPMKPIEPYLIPKTLHALPAPCVPQFISVMRPEHLQTGFIGNFIFHDYTNKYYPSNYSSTL